MWIFQYLKSVGDNFGKVDSELYRGALPSDYSKLKKLGVTVVVNLMDEDGAWKELGKTRKAGIKDWFHIPLSDKKEPQVQDVKNFLQLFVDDPTGVFFVHCKGGRHRTGMMIAAYRMKFDGWSFDKAYEEMKKFGWYSALGHKPLKEFLKRGEFLR